MSSVAVNDENHGVCPGRKKSISSNDIFALEQTTGRPSILRQAENLPNKTVAKGAKVCFQTPRRDPVTKRILSPTKSVKITSIDECTRAMDTLTLQLDNTKNLPQEYTKPFDEHRSEVSSYPKDEMPIQSNTGYQLDFDSLDDINPFQGSNKVALSPARPAVEELPPGQNCPQHEIPEEPTKTETVLDETLPFILSVEDSFINVSTNICSTDSSVVTVAKDTNVEDQDIFSTPPQEELPAVTYLGDDQQKTMASFCVEDFPLPTKGSYNLDLDNLDSVDPFQTGGSKIQNSPVLGRKVACNDVPVNVSPVKEMQPENTFNVQEEPVDSEVKLTAAVAPFSDDISMPTDDKSISQAVFTSKEGPVKLEFNFDDGSEVTQKPPPKKCSKCPPDLKSTEKRPALEKDSTPPKESTASTVAIQQKTIASFCVEDFPLPTKGSYNLDLDNLASINPFQTGGSKIQNSPVLGRNVACDDMPVKVSPVKQMQLENTFTVQEEPVYFEVKPTSAVAPISDDISMPTDDESTSQAIFTSKEGPVKLEFNFDDGSEVTQKPPPKKFSKCPPGLKSTEKKPALKKDSTSVKESSASTVAIQQKTIASFCVEDFPLPTKGSYNLDLDVLDSINPFQTGGSKIQNSPVLGRNVASNDVPVNVSPVKEMQLEETFNVQEESVDSEVKLTAAVAPISNDLSMSTDDESTSQAVFTSKEGPVKLEFNFDDGSEVKRKPPPKKFSKCPPGLKSTEKKPALEKDSTPPKESSASTVANQVDEASIPTGSYLNLEKFDNANFNPFGNSSKMADSPKCGIKSSLAGKALTPVIEKTNPEPKPSPVENEAVLSMCSGDNFSPKSESSHAAQNDDNKMSKEESKAASDYDLGSQAEAEQSVLSVPEPFKLGQHEQKSQTGLSEPNEVFVPGTMFMSNDFDGQIDYLEQFGSGNFKESALRKQSLYLKFDPLLKDSPKKSGGPAVQNSLPHPSMFASHLKAPQTTEEAAKQPKNEHSKLVDDMTTSLVGPVIQNPPMLDSLVPPFPQPANTEDAIIEMLKYSQKDLDAAIAKVQAEAEKKEEQWSVKCAKLCEDGHEMRKVISEFELVTAQILANQEKERGMAQEKLNKALLEKEQLAGDLNAMEKSFSELFKRLGKYKDVIEGYKKNEATLKACAEEYLMTIKKEEQRYETLKAHAEEKIDRANEEIAEVRSRLKTEVSALQAQLRREQLKVQSLQKNLDQKVKEAEELSNLCDELINSVQKR
ncbi:transforming acidic coiled-coil-containing protein 3 [Lampris incognitus]|uniref:transforming acidic coiled-coil-containing protein 3 n=1 Tax=Lampris incognitus TaxID=2546036 RepID=UPI0024B53B46|nr:transforming acidic coiled-coil-containing protein 3 [Lampris incognitus]